MFINDDNNSLQYTFEKYLMKTTTKSHPAVLVPNLTVLQSSYGNDRTFWNSGELDKFENTNDHADEKLESVNEVTYVFQPEASNCLVFGGMESAIMKKNLWFINKVV